MSHLQAQLFLAKSRISHFMPALESLDFSVPRFPPAVWDWIFRQDFSVVGGFCCIYWISSALSSLTQHSVHLSIWLTAYGDRGSRLFTARLFALALSYTVTPDCEVKSMVSYTGLCQSQTVVAKAQSLEHVDCWVLAVSAYCLQHLTLEREAERSRSLAPRSTTLSCMCRMMTIRLECNAT